jgi:hypothetical protein
MKLNVMKIANRIRYAYLTEEQAQVKNLDMGKYHKLKSILTKLEKIFYGAGGKPENLKKAILTGKGNKDHEVSGLGMVADTTFYDEHTPLNVLLSGIYEEEMTGGLSGLGFVTSAAIAAASSALAVVAGLIKQIGGVKKGDKGGSGGDGGGSGDGASDNSTDNSSNDNSSTDDSGGSNNKMMRKSNTSNSTSKTASTDGGDDSSGGGDKPQGFLEKTKTWVKEHPMQAGAVAIGVTALGVLAVKHFTKKKEKPATALSGVYHKKHKKKKGKKHSHKHKHHKAPIALL